ncbi:MAG TPA: carboxypeptidase M32 [Gemmatimonadaceae bacterium]|jgi:carboxypeptidase Taq|nr:carboxypeptidase M32 [Gemmatimonadaceae bacterium]
MTPEQAYAELIRLSRTESILSSCAQLLQWDAEINMPRRGVEHRGEQMGLLAGLAHERATDPRRAELLSIVESSPLISDPDSVEAVNIRELRHDYDRATRLPRDLVEEMARVSAMSSQAWSEARDKDDFAAFEPWLDKTFDLARQKADAFGYERDRYDALLEDFEPGMTAAQLTPMFERLRADLVPLVESVREKKRSEVTGDFPLDKQRDLSEGIARKLGYTADTGRFDLGPHPFCAFIGPGDVRIALRYRTNDFGSGFLAVMHETGHAFYELGLDDEHYGTPMGSAVSLGIHESQSRLWENFVGRSPGFWQHFYPDLQKAFPDPLGGVSADAFRTSMNRVEPGLIRVEADEVTYNLHIIIRYELERALLDGNLTAKDLPGAWSELYHQYLGITPPDDRNGCMQDIHWSEGLIAYFPTYTLGNIYSAQIFAAANRDVGPLEESFAAGEFSELREWLHQKIYQHGRRYKAPALVEKATGSAPDSSHLIASLQERYG